MDYKQLVIEACGYKETPFCSFYQKMIAKHQLKDDSFFCSYFKEHKDDKRHVATIVAQFIRVNPVRVKIVSYDLTESASLFLKENNVSPNDLLDRLYAGDVGRNYDSDLLDNYVAVLTGEGRILAVYPVAVLGSDKTEDVWVIHYPEGPETTVLMPDDY